MISSNISIFSRRNCIFLGVFLEVICIFLDTTSTSYLHRKNIDSADFGNAASPSNPEDLNIQDAATRYDTASPMTCLLDYIKQFANKVKIDEGILFPEDSDIDFNDLENIK